MSAPPPDAGGNSPPTQLTEEDLTAELKLGNDDLDKLDAFLDAVEDLEVTAGVNDDIDEAEVDCCDDKCHPDDDLEFAAVEMITVRACGWRWAAAGPLRHSLLVLGACLCGPAIHPSLSVLLLLRNGPAPRLTSTAHHRKWTQTSASPR